MTVRKAAVIGSGVMGAGIAAHMANAGIDVTLLDIVPSDCGDRSSLARKAVERLASAYPPALASTDCAALITPGNIEDDLDRLAEVEWVVEAVVENLAIKRDILARVAAAAPQAAITSNTSTLSLAALMAELAPSVAERLFITHFFNPPRQMRLVEVVAHSTTRPDLLARVEASVDRQLGKSIVRCTDTPGFVANRLGTYWMCLAVAEALDRKITPAAADVALSGPFGIPPTGVFGLLDLIGLDTIEKGLASMMGALAPDDPLKESGSSTAWVFRTMVRNGLLGRKVKAGFYRTATVRENVDLATSEYREAAPPSPDTLPGGGRDPVAMISGDGQLSAYAWSVMSGTFAYACAMVPNAAASPAEIDEAMTLGYAWRKGPFQLMDSIGLDNLRARYRATGQTVPPLLESAGASFYRDTPTGRSVAVGGGGRIAVERPAGLILAGDLRRAGSPVAGNRSASLWNMGDGIALFEIHSKMNTLDDEVAALLTESLGIVRDRFRGLVIGSDAANFSAGANLAKTVEWIKAGNFSALERTLEAGQRAMLDLKYAPFPVVAALAGVALGGGCEIVLHCDAVQSHLECTIGLVERNVGILPGWGGVAQMLARFTDTAGDPAKGAVAAFEVIGRATTCTSAHLARNHQFLRPLDGLTMNRDRLLADAKDLALSLVRDYRPPARPQFALGTPVLHATLTDAVAALAEHKTTSPYDLVIADKLAWILGGGDAGEGLSDEAALHSLERSVILQLVRDERTVARMEHMLATGKPLRN